MTVEVNKTFKDSVLIEKSFVKMLADGNYITLARNNQIMQQKVNILSDKGNQYVLENTFEPNDLLLLEDTGNLPSNAKLDFKIVK